MRAQLGYTQVKLAQLSGVSLPTIQNIESSKTNPTVDVLNKILMSLGMEIKAQPLPIDIQKASVLGVPLTSSDESNKDLKPNAAQLIHEMNRWPLPLMMKQFNHRDEEAIVAFVTAIYDHYPKFYTQNIENDIFNQKILEFRSNARIPKLRRMALNQLSKYL